MTGLVRSISNTGGKSKVLATLLVMALVVSLFLIPEIVHYQKSNKIDWSSSTASSLVDVSSKATSDSSVNSSGVGVDSDRASLALPNVGNSSTTSPLSAILTTLENVGSAVSNTVTGDQIAKNVLSITNQSQNNNENSLGDNPLTWDSIRSAQSNEALQKARSEALEIISALPAKKSTTKFALLNYVNGISTIQGSPERFSDATEAILYVENLDQSVTRAMFRDKVERTDFNRWSAVSLGETLRVSRAARMKQNYIMPFNPQLTLTNVRVSKQMYDVSPNDPHPSRKPVADIEGFVVGKDITAVKLLLDGQVVGQAPLGSPDAETNRRVFQFGHLDARGIYTIEVFGAGGEKFSRSYNFYDKARSFPWDKRDSNFIIPFRSENNRIDRRVDRYFRYSGAESSDSSGFSTF